MRAIAMAASVMAAATKKAKAARAMAKTTKMAMAMAVRGIVTATKTGKQRRQEE